MACRLISFQCVVLPFTGLVIFTTVLVWIHQAASNVVATATDTSTETPVFMHHEQTNISQLEEIFYNPKA
jgi:hypothetical protein